MALFVRVYYNAVLGALGGLIGWMLFGALGDKAAPQGRLTEQLALGGALIGGLIGYLVVGADALRDRAPVRFGRLASYGAALGAAGGALGMLLGDAVNFGIVAWLGADRDGGAPALAGAMLARGLGWLFLGAAVGAGEGVAARSLGKFSYGTLGGALGGFVGGALFALLYLTTPDRAGSAAFGGALGLAVLGACIGSLSALVQGVFRPASVRVLRGWQEGREYPLDKAASLLGRDEHADVALFRDRKVEKRHALIRRDGGRFELVNNGAPPEQTRVNDRAVAASCPLDDGDRIQLGNVVLRFQARGAGRQTAGRPHGPETASQRN